MDWRQVLAQVCSLWGQDYLCIAVGVTALATSLGAGVAVIVAGLTSIITGIGFFDLCSAQKLGLVHRFITNGAPAIGEAIKALVLTMVDVLVECVPLRRRNRNWRNEVTPGAGCSVDIYTSNRGFLESDPHWFA